MDKSSDKSKYVETTPKLYLLILLKKIIQLQQEPENIHINIYIYVYKIHTYIYLDVLLLLYVCLKHTLYYSNHFIRKVYQPYFKPLPLNASLLETV